MYSMQFSKWIYFLVVIIVFILFCLVKIYRVFPWRKGSSRQHPIKDFYLEWNDYISEGVVYYKEIIPEGYAKLDVLLLHGMSFSSRNWVELNTMNILASHGYHVIALDLPGYGKSLHKLDTSDSSRVVFLEQFIKKTRLVSPVIVSPSMSGVYSLTYLAASKASRAFVAIAVVGTEKIPVGDFQNFPPTLIVQGSRDKNLGVTSTSILSKNVPHNSVQVIQDAGHACYMNKPDEFHTMLLKFLNNIAKSESG
ncbi:protein ABHD14B-like [Dendronephthya gigantea]|uniref:protein ABHD14B-like n=1 Tax=Dendronephthya gigantea TaxID=151771 RepID=UPI00106A7639|nr:protein ABHD14B-like [Dendronephthya gigantea]